MHSDFAGNKMLVSITENACRVCLAEQEIMINLFDTVEDFEKKRLYDLLESCSSIKIDRADGQRKLICGDCTGELLVVAKFQAKCEQTMEILSQMEHLIVDEDKSPASEEGCEVDDDKVKYEVAEIEHSLDNADDMDNFIIEEHDIVDEEVEADGAISPLPDETRPEENIIFQEVSYVDEEDADNEDLILFEPDPGTDCTAHSKRQNVAEKLKLKTTVTPRPLIINYKCDVCGAGFAQVNNLARHIQTHNPAEVYECSTCHHPFTSSLHVELHNEENPKCGDTVEKQIKMCTYDTKEGILSTKSDEIPVVTEKTPPTSDDTRKSKLCNICNKAFVSKSALETHLRIHTGDRPFKCSICLKGFKSQGGLVLHLRRHSGIRPYSCNVCNKSFSESSNLRVHMRTHTGEKPHKCTICNRSFARVFLLQLHLRTHTGERPYQCPYCSKAFAQAGDLTSHKRTHTGERPHVCPICKKGFIKSSGLTQHMRKHTNQGAKYDSIMACEDSSQDKEDDREEGTDWHIIHEDQITENDGETDDLSGLRMEFKVEDYVIEFPQEIET